MNTLKCSFIDDLLTGRLAGFQTEERYRWWYVWQSGQLSQAVDGEHTELCQTHHSKCHLYTRAVIL